jgi:hypothetical protein
MADAFAVLYLPIDEDSYGYVTLEAFHAAKSLQIHQPTGRSGGGERPGG